jgi:DNA-binding MarR family transcriptional regulator
MYMKMVVNKDDEAFDALVRTWSVWWSKVPGRLARQESSLVVRLLTLGLRQGGIPQSKLKQQLGIAQPRLSKLMVKLLKVKWIKVQRSETDRRVWLMTTTAAAQDRMVALKADLAAVLRARGAKRARAPVPQSKPAPFRRGRRIREQPGQTKFKLRE